MENGDNVKAYCRGKKIVGKWIESADSCLPFLWLYGSPIISVLYAIGYYWEVGIVSEIVRLLHHTAPMLALFTNLLLIVALLGDVVFGLCLISTAYGKMEKPSITAIGRLALILKKCN